MSDAPSVLALENPRAQEARGWVKLRLKAKGVTDDERYLLGRISKFPFERFPDETVPWHLLQWPYMRWGYVRLLVDMIESFRHVKGSYAGKDIELEPFQILILVCFFGPFDIDTGARLVRTMLLTLARKQAKELSVDCPIPTPDGWKRNGDLSPGDKVFGADGRPCNVIGVSDVRIPDVAYRLAFSDGSQIDAGAGHQWLTRHRWRPWAVVQKGPRKGEKGVMGNHVEQVVTTEQIARSLMVDRLDGGVEYNHSIELCGPVEYSKQGLPLDPYTLGIWLSEGHSAGSRVTLNFVDAEHIVPRLSLSAVMTTEHENCDVYKLGEHNELVPILRELGVLNNKHIPEQYLCAGVSQRRELLRGILDGDGHAEGSNTNTVVQISVKQVPYANGIVELVRSLGFKPTIYERDGKINGVAVGRYQDIQFSAYQEDEVFSLPRQNAALKPRPLKKARSSRRQIVACEPITPGPMRCISVDGPDNLYLAGREYIVTHNSTLISAAITAAMALRPDKGGYFRQELYVGASDREQAGEIYEICSGLIMLDRTLGIADKFKCVPSGKLIQHKDTLTKLKVLSSDAYRAHGRNAVAVIYDEIGNVPTTAAKEFYSVLASGFGAQDEGMVALLSTQAASDIHLFSEMVDKCKGVNAKRIEVDYDLAGFVFEVPDRIDNEEIDPFDERYWYLANPGLLSGPNGMRKTLLPDLRKQAKEAKDLPSLEAEFRNRRLNQRANLRSPVVSASLWKGCSDPSLSLDDPGLLGKRCWVGLDLSSTRDLTAAVLVFEEIESLGGIRPTFAQFWMPSHGLEARARQDKVPYPFWAEQGLVNIEAEKVVDYRYVAQWLAEQTARFELAGLGYDKWRAEDFKVAAKEESALAEYLDSDEIFIEIYQSAKYVEPCIEAVENSLLLKQIAHNGNPVLTWCAANAVSIKNPDGHRKWDKAKSYGRIDGIVALGMALRCREVQAILYGDVEGAAEDDDFAM